MDSDGAYHRLRLVCDALNLPPLSWGLLHTPYLPGGGVPGTPVLGVPGIMVRLPVYKIPDVEIDVPVDK